MSTLKYLLFKYFEVINANIQKISKLTLQKRCKWCQYIGCVIHIAIRFIFQITTYNKLVKKERTTKNEEQDEDFKIIKKGIAETCVKLSRILDKINKNISYHNTKWFSTYRSLDLTDLIDSLNYQCKIINERILFINLF